MQKSYETGYGLAEGWRSSQKYYCSWCIKRCGIAIDISHLLENEEINFVIMGTCYPDYVALQKQYDISLCGNVLAIYDSIDELSGPCQELFALSGGKGLARHDEIVPHIDTGHGILYKPLDEWLIPAVEWARGK